MDGGRSIDHQHCFHLLITFFKENNCSGAQERDESYQKHGASMGESTWAQICAQAKNHQSAWEKISGLKFQLTSRTISLHGRKLLRENFTSVHKIYPLAPAPCSLPLRKQSFRNFNSLRKNTPEQDDCL